MSVRSAADVCRLAPIALIADKIPDWIKSHDTNI